MADKSSQLIVEALHRAATQPEGLPLIAARNRAGLFGGSASGKKAAEQAKVSGFLRVLRTEANGKTSCELCGITEKGLAHLMSQVGTRGVLEDFVRALEGRQEETSALLEAARGIQAGLDSLRTTVEKVLQQGGASSERSAPGATAQNGSSGWKPYVLSYLAQWQAGGALEDCPIPDLYRKAKQTTATFTIGQFHDGLRALHQQEQIYLHPWTGPLYDMPDPAYALLVGHEVAYYVSLRDGGPR